MTYTRYSRWDQIFGEAINRLERAGYDVRKLRKQFRFYKQEVLKYHRAQQAEQRNCQGSLSFHFGTYSGTPGRIRSLSDTRLQPLRFPTELSNVREFMATIEEMLVIHLYQHLEKGTNTGTSKALNRVSKEIQRVQTSWL
jgi:hypothetical protein